jgi:pyruvate kinase
LYCSRVAATSLLQFAVLALRSLDDMATVVASQTTIGRTKIVATIGPASSAPEVLFRLIESGVSVFRLNFSHGTHEGHAKVVSDIRSVSRAIERHVAILQDLCGPKMRLGPVPGDVIDCQLGEEFTLVSEPSPDGVRELTCSYKELPDDLKPGETVLFADGNVAMAVTDTSPGVARLKVTLAGRLRSRQGVNLPGSNLAVESLTDKDLADLDWTAQHADDVDFVGLSFVRGANDVARLRQELRARACRARIVVKIEKPQAVDNLESIIAATDAVMVARGDLGVEMDVQRVPSIQKRIIALCNLAHRPVITATQMLNSMEHSNRPTRAEASDVFNAVLDGSDAVMLSGETAVGEYPVETVATMRRICAEAEVQLKSRTYTPAKDSAAIPRLLSPITEAGADAVCVMARRLGAALILVAADSGRSALALSNRRPSAPVLALARTEEVARLLGLCWGVEAIVLRDWGTAEQVLAFGVNWATSHGLVRKGQHAVLLRGQTTGHENTVAIMAGEVP